MNLTLGCREKVGDQWTYYLLDGKQLTRAEWTKLVKEHIKEQRHADVFAKLKQTVKLWNKDDSAEEVAMHVYASKYCTNLQVSRRLKYHTKEAQDEMGCSQLSLV